MTKLPPTFRNREMLGEAPRIVIYGAGQFGQYIVRIATIKGWPIVAAFNRAGDKIGKDIGELAGIEPIGVKVQDCDTASYEIEADIAIVAITDQLKINIVAYRRLLGAGMNVICHGAASHYAKGMDAEISDEIDQLAKANAVSFAGCGIWDMSRTWAGILATAPCTDITSITHTSITDAEMIGKELMMVTGITMTPAQYEAEIASQESRMGSFYKVIPHQVADAIGYTVTKVTERREPIIYDEPIFCKLLERDIVPGECAGTRIVAEVHTQEGLTINAHIELRIFREGEKENMIWEVEGKPSLKVTVERTDAGYFTAASMFNRIPDVIDAEPGLQPISKLGLMRHSALI